MHYLAVYLQALRNFFNTSEMIRSDISLSTYTVLQRKVVLSTVLVLYDQ